MTITLVEGSTAEQPTPPDINAMLSQATDAPEQGEATPQTQQAAPQSGEQQAGGEASEEVVDTTEIDNTLLELENILRQPPKQQAQVIPIAPEPVGQSIPEPEDRLSIPDDDPLLVLVPQEWRQLAKDHGPELAEQLCVLSDQRIMEYQQAGGEAADDDTIMAIVRKYDSLANNRAKTFAAKRDSATRLAKMQDEQRIAKHLQQTEEAWVQEVTRLSPNIANSEIGQQILGTAMQAAYKVDPNHKTGAKLAVMIAKAISQSIVEYKKGNVPQTAIQAVQSARQPVTIPPSAASARPNQQGDEGVDSLLQAMGFGHVVNARK